MFLNESQLSGLKHNTPTDPNQRGFSTEYGIGLPLQHMMPSGNLKYDLQGSVPPQSMLSNTGKQ